MVAPGEVIGVYQLDRLLGAGSTSKVFLGRHTLLGRQAAIKVLAPELVSNQDVVSRLLTEARVVNDIRHPNIIDIIDFVVIEKPRRVALVMELIEGPSLMTLRGYSFSYARALGLMLQIVDAVAGAHAAGVIHRDIKPDNLLLCEDPRETRGIPTLKVVDFGIAKLAGKSGRTATGMMLGTPAYMAPEQVAGRPPPSAATDVFAIGEVLYELLASQRAYPSAAIHETVRAKLRGELPDLQLPENTPNAEQLMALIVQCLERRPEDRPTITQVRKILIDLFPTNWRPDTSLAERLIANAVSTGRHPIPDLGIQGPTQLAPMLLPEDVDQRSRGNPMSVLAAKSVEDTVDPAAMAGHAAPVTEPFPVARLDEITDRSADDDQEFASTQLSFDDDVVMAPTLPPAAETELAMGAGIRPEASSPTNRTMEALLETNNDDDGDGDTAVTMLGADALLQPAGVADDPPETKANERLDAHTSSDRRQSRITRELELAVNDAEANLDRDATNPPPVLTADDFNDPSAVVESGDVQMDPAKDHHPQSVILGAGQLRERPPTPPKPKSRVWLLIGALWIVACALIAAILFNPNARKAALRSRTSDTHEPATPDKDLRPVIVRTAPAGAAVTDALTGQPLGETPFTLDAALRRSVKRVTVTRKGGRSVEIDLATADGTVWVEID